MAGTTIRVDPETHRLLQEMSAEAGEPQREILRQAVKALWQKRLLEGAVEDFARLEADPVAWADYMAEVELLHNTDGLD